MGIALGTRLTPVTFEIPKLQLPFEQMYAQMQGMQQEKDVYDTMKGMMPQYVSADKPLVEAGLKEVSSLVEGVSNAYSTGKVSDAMRGIRQAKGVLSEMWKPTGVFGAVQGFYQDYQKAMQEVEEFTKGNTDPAYKFVYQRAVQKAAEQGSGFDPLTGKRKTVAAPDMVKELDVITEFSKFAEGWGSAADQTVGMKKVGNYYYWVGTEKKVSEEEVQSAWRSYISSPKIQAHLGIQAAYEVGNLAPEQEQSFRDLMLKDAEGSFKQSKDSLSAIKTMLDSNNPAQIRRAQKALGVKDDGIVGDNTRKAYEELNQTLTENSEKVKQAYMEGDLTNLAKQRLERTLERSVIDRYAFSQKDGKLVARQDQIEMLRHSNRRSEIQYEFMLKNIPEAPYFGGTAVIPVTMPNIAQAAKEHSDVYRQQYNNFFRQNPVLGNAIKSMTGDRRYGEAMPMIVDALRQASNLSGRVDYSVFSQIMTQNGFRDGNKNPMYNGSVMNWKNFVDKFNNNEFTIGTLENASIGLQNSYAMMMDSKAVIDRFANAVEKDKAVDWNKLSVDKSKNPLLNVELGQTSYTKYSPQELQAEFKKGNPAVVDAVANYLGQNKLKNYTHLVKGYSFSGGIAKKFDENFLEQLKSQPGSLLSVIPSAKLTYLDETTREALGVKKQLDGTYTIDPNLQVTNFGLAHYQENGTDQAQMSLTFTKQNKEGKAVSHTIMVPKAAINPKWMKERALVIASSYMTSTGEVSDRNAFLNTSAQLFDNVNGVFIGNNESHIASQVEANRHKVFEQRVLFDNIELQPGRGGITSNLVSTTMLTGEGKIVHLSGRDTAGEFIKQANGDYRRFMQLVSNAPVEVQQNIFEQPIGSYTQGPDGVRNLKVNKQDLSDAIYNMKAVTNEFNTLQGAMKMLEKKRVATPQQIMSESSSYSRSYVPQDDFNEFDD